MTLSYGKTEGHLECKIIASCALSSSWPKYGQLGCSNCPHLCTECMQCGQIMHQCDRETRRMAGTCHVTSSCNCSLQFTNLLKMELF